MLLANWISEWKLWLVYAKFNFIQSKQGSIIYLICCIASQFILVGILVKWPCFSIHLSMSCPLSLLFLKMSNVDLKVQTIWDFWIWTWSIDLKKYDSVFVFLKPPLGWVKYGFKPDKGLLSLLCLYIYALIELIHQPWEWFSHISVG